MCNTTSTTEKSYQKGPGLDDEFESLDSGTRNRDHFRDHLRDHGGKPGLPTWVQRLDRREIEDGSLKAQVKDRSTRAYRTRACRDGYLGNCQRPALAMVEAV